jgi:hypothetical protein
MLCFESGTDLGEPKDLQSLQIELVTMFPFDKSACNLFQCRKSPCHSHYNTVIPADS